jgi:hypothetical protein
MLISALPPPGAVAEEGYFSRILDLAVSHG